MTAQPYQKFRRVFLLFLAVSPALAESPSSSATDPARATGNLPPLHGLEEVGHRDVRLKGGFWGPRHERHHRTTIPHVLDKPEERHHVTNFEIAVRVIIGGSIRYGTVGTEQARRHAELPGS